MSDLLSIDLDEVLSRVPADDIESVVSSVLADSTLDIQAEVQDSLPYTKRISVNDLVPQDIQNRLMAIDQTMNTCYWLIGDIADDLMNSINRQKSATLGKVVSQLDVCQAVGYFCHRTGRSVRYYWECARYFPPDVRQKYDVPFSVWAEARWSKEPYLMLDIANDNPQWSLERVRQEYYQQTGDAKREYTKQEGNIPDSGAEAPDDEPAERLERADGPEKYKAVLLAKLDHTIGDLRNAVERMRLPQEIKVRIGDCILELEAISQVVRLEI